ncbi:MAG: transglutaminase domain-containing protein [Sphingomonas sp.]|uniref:transglutaminase domain-containing protein n=1 Tax=Sphingomonas sp. TaxID=28214 RepID=UPI0035684B9A
MFTLQQGSLAGGDLGTEQTLGHMRRLVLNETALPIVRMVAAQIAANVPGNDPMQLAQHIRRFVKARWRFVRDPLDKELLHTPEALLRMLQMHQQIAADCDDAAILCAALGVSVGLRARFVAVSFLDERAPYGHVWAELAPPTGTGSWVECDVTRSMQTLPMHLIARYVLFPVISDNMHTLRGSMSGRGEVPASRSATPNASPFSGLGSYGGAGLSAGALGEALFGGLGMPDDFAVLRADLSRAEALLPKTPKPLRGVLVSRIAAMKRKIASYAPVALSPIAPAAPPIAPPVAAPSPTDVPAPVSVPTYAQPILIAPPASSDFAPSRSSAPQALPLYPVPSELPLAVDAAASGEQPSLDAARSGGANGGLFSSPWVWVAVGVLAFVVARGPGARSLR